MRNLQIVHYNFPLTAVCDNCNVTFHTQSHVAESAGHELRAAFNAHTCRLLDRQDASEASEG